MQAFIIEGIFEDIKEDNKITEIALSKKYNVSERTIRRYIKVLKDNGKITMDKTGRKRTWLIISK